MQTFHHVRFVAILDPLAQKITEEFYHKVTLTAFIHKRCIVQEDQRSNLDEFNYFTNVNLTS